MEQETKKDIYSVALKMVARLDAMNDTSAGKALCASLRNTIGKDIKDASEVWPFLFSNMPEEYLGNGGNATYTERAIFTILQIYALCHQGEAKQRKNRDVEKIRDIGGTLACLKDYDISKSAIQRFNVLITSSTYDELVHHLRQLIKILKSKEEVIINYGQLAKDLLYFQIGYQQEVKMQWAKSFYRVIKSDEEGEIL